MINNVFSISLFVYFELKDWSKKHLEYRQVALYHHCQCLIMFESQSMYVQLDLCPMILLELNYFSSDNFLKQANNFLSYLQSLIELSSKKFTFLSVLWQWAALPVLMSFKVPYVSPSNLLMHTRFTKICALLMSLRLFLPWKISRKWTSWFIGLTHVIMIMKSDKYLSSCSLSHSLSKYQQVQTCENEKYLVTSQLQLTQQL